MDTRCERQWVCECKCEWECECECECVYIQMSSGCFRLVGARLRNHFVCGSRFLSGAEITSWGRRKGGGAAGLLGPLQLQLVRRLPFNLPRHILQKDVAGSQLKVQFQGEGAADRTCRKRERKAWLSWSVCVSLLGSHPNPATNHSRHSFAGRGIPNRTHHIAYEQYF